jgi:hypothetical protein
MQLNGKGLGVRPAARFEDVTMCAHTTMAVWCKNCGRTADHSFCAYCGQKTETRRLDGETLLDELIEVGSHASNRLLHTIRGMIFRPGEVIRDYLNGKRRTYQDPISFFAFSFLFVEFLNRFVIEPQDLPRPLFIRLDREWCFVCMTIIAIAAYVIAVKPKLNLVETVVLFAFVEGVTYLYAGILILVSALFADRLQGIGSPARELLLDLPYLTIVVFYFVWVYRSVIKGPLWRLGAAIVVDLGVFAVVWIGVETQILQNWFNQALLLIQRGS